MTESFSLRENDDAAFEVAIIVTDSWSDFFHAAVPTSGPGNLNLPPPERKCRTGGGAGEQYLGDAYHQCRHMVEVPTPTAENLFWFLAGLLAGLPAPYWYSAERIRGFSRTLLSKLPYKPPPGKTSEEALEDASRFAEGDEEDGEGEEE